MNLDPLFTRRQLLRSGTFGALALTSMLQREALGAPFHHKPRAKRVVYLFQSGGPSQIDLFDHKPRLAGLFDQELPPSVRMGQRLTGMTSGQSRLPLAPSAFSFAQHGQSGAWFSELLPNMAKVADDLTIVRSMQTDAINHDPAITFFQTGAQQAGRPSVGSWITYGLGTQNADLPAFVVLVSRGTGRPSCQPLYDRLWGAGFLPTTFQGVKLRGQGDPVLYLTNPPGFDAATRRRVLDDVVALNAVGKELVNDPEIATRTAQYELAYRMQTSVPELTDLGNEPEATFARYGPESRRRGSYAANCLLARRLLERDVRFVQLYHMGWDQHGNLPKQLPGQCKDVDQPTAALITDLKERGLLDDTLLVWTGEFGRTVYSQGTLTKTNYGRDHHPRCFTTLLAGAGLKPGTFGETDEFGYNVVRDPVHVHDLNATILHCLGIDHTRLTTRFQGRYFRLTDVHGKVVAPLLG